MSVGIPLDAVLIETQAVSVDAELCKRVRYRKSTCQSCVDVCPDNAITLSPGPVINASCTHCGLCQNACPTEVFQNDVNVDQALLQQVGSPRSKDQAVANKNRVFIHCSQAETQDDNSLAIHCLGNMSENFFLGSALSGLDEIILTHGHCSQCQLKNAEGLFTKSIKTSQAIIKNMGLEKCAMTLIEEQKAHAEAPRLTRRALFSKISATSSLTEQVDEDVTNARLAMKDGTRFSPRRELLHKLIKQNALGVSDENVTQQGLPWRKMKVDEANCVACAICVKVCPTGALTKIFENNQVIRLLNDSVCTNCNLCQEACPEHVISFEEDYALTDLIEDKTYVVARIDMTSCAICGEIIPAGRGEICTTCEKRQIAPMFMR